MQDLCLALVNKNTGAHQDRAGKSLELGDPLKHKHCAVSDNRRLDGGCVWWPECSRGVRGVVYWVHTSRGPLSMGHPQVSPAHSVTVISFIMSSLRSRESGVARNNALLFSPLL